MKCILSTIGKQLLEEVHAGQCGIHAASRTLVGKVFREAAARRGPCWAMRDTRSIYAASK
jgi:hypothetical protein